MMEENDIFKTETICDEVVYAEYTRSYILTRRGLIWSHLLFEITLLVMLLHFSNEEMIFRFLFWSAIYLAVAFLVLPGRLKNHYRKILTTNQGQQPHNRIHLRGDGIVLVNPRTGNEEFHSYFWVRRIIDTPKLVLLHTMDNRCIILQKCWLLGGSPEELVAFLTEKCTRVRRAQGIQLGLWVRRILIATMIAGSLFGVILLYGEPIRPEESRSYAEISEELSALGITIREETIAEVESFYAEYPLSSQSSAAKVQELLYMEGMGEYDMDTLEWTPSASGVYWMDTEVFFVDSIYTDFLAGLSAMDEDLDFSNVQEDYSQVDLESGVGTVPVSFDFRGQHYEMDARYHDDWFDSDVLSAVTGIVNSTGDDKWLYCAFDGGQGFLFYYGTPDDVRALEKLTDLQFGTGSSWFSRIFI